MSVDLNRAFATNHRPSNPELTELARKAGCGPEAAEALVLALHARCLLIDRVKAVAEFDLEEEALRRTSEELLERLLDTVRTQGDGRPVWKAYTASLNALMEHVAQPR